MFKIGDIEIKNRIVLAPMAGVSNASYMRICEEMGVGYAVTELMSSEAIIRDNKKTYDMLNGIDTLNMPVAIQLFGSNPLVMSKAAKIILEKYKVDMIDINMGCPVPKVVKTGAGSALLKDLDKVRDIVSSVVNSVSVPITVKIRIGWNEDNINAVEVARVCEEAGASAIAVHGRTREQGYSGSVNLDVIRDVVNAVKIPVIGNGDIRCGEDAKKMLDYTGCSAVMIGRAVMGNPWLIKEIITYLESGININKPSILDKVNMCLKHLDYLLMYKNEKASVLEMRSHISWYLKGVDGSQEIKEKCFKAQSREELVRILEEYKIKLL